MATLKITYAPCGYANVLSFSLAGWAGGWQRYFLCVCFKNSYDLNSNSCSLALQSSDLGFPSLMGNKTFFVLRIFAMLFQIIQFVMLPVKGAISTAP